MSLHRRHNPLIKQGWLRALLLLFVYTAISLAGSFFVTSLEVWISLLFLFSLLLVYLFRKYVDKRNTESLGLYFSSLYPDSLIGFALGTFLITAGALLIYLLNGLIWVDLVFNGDALILSTGLLIMIAFYEELVFRGYVLHNLLKSFNKWLALIISAVLFTIVHVSNAGIPPLGIMNTFLGGLLTGVTYMYTRNLWLPIFLHFSWNFIQGPVVGFAVSGVSFFSIMKMELTGNELLSGGRYGFEGSAICGAMLLIAVISFSYLEHKKPTA